MQQLGVLSHDRLQSAPILPGEQHRYPIIGRYGRSSGYSETIRFLGYKIVDGEHSACFVFDFGGAWQANPEPDVDLEANRRVALFTCLAHDLRR